MKENFFIVNSNYVMKKMLWQENVMASKISLSKDLIDVKARNNHRVSVLKPYLFVLLCLLIELHRKLKVCLCIFFFKIVSSKLMVGLIYGCGLFMDFYGRVVLTEVFLERETEAFALQRHKRFLDCKTRSKHDNIEFLLRDFVVFDTVMLCSV